MSDQRYLVLALTVAPAGLEDAIGEWAAEHVREMVDKVPGYLSGQAFAVHAELGNPHPAAEETRPAYSHLTVYEVDEEGAAYIAAKRQEYLSGAPETPGFPGGVGPHRPDSYVFVPLTRQFVAGGDQSEGQSGRSARQPRPGHPEP